MSDFFEDLSEVIHDALDSRTAWQGAFTEEEGSPPLANLIVLYRQGLIAARLRAHPELSVREGRSLEGGRVEVIFPDGGMFLLKPKGAIDTMPSVGEQGTLVETQSDEVIGYIQANGGIALYRAPYVRISVDGQNRDVRAGAWTLMFTPADPPPSDDWDDLDDDIEDVG